MSSTLKSLENDFRGLSLQVTNAYELKKQVDQLVKDSTPTLQLPPPVPPRPTPIDLTKWADRDLDPESTSQTVHQYQLLRAYLLGSWKGLTETVKDFVKKDYDSLLKPGVNSPHRHIIEDHTLGSPIMACLLACIHGDFLRAMLEGNVSQRVFSDAKFAAMVDLHHVVNYYPGIYLIEVVNSKSESYPGRCLNWREWKVALRNMRAYVQAYRNKTVTSLTKDIDTIVPPPSTERDLKFRFARNDTAADTLQEFINRCQENYVDPGEKVHSANPNDPRLDVAFSRSKSHVTAGELKTNRFSSTGSRLGLEYPTTIK